MILENKLNKPFVDLKTLDLVPVLCDYCGSEFEKTKRGLTVSRRKVNKDCCKKKECVSQKIKESFEKTYGVSHVMHLDSAKNKLKETCLKKYGVSSVFKDKSIKEKIKKTNLSKYGSESILALPEFREKIKNTNLKKYGFSSFSKTKQFLEKIKKTNLKKYGVEFPLQNSLIKLKLEKTNFSKYGVFSTLGCEIIKAKIKKTNFEKYGVEHHFSSQEIQKKIKQTNIEKYGFECPLSSLKIQEKVKQTNIEKYGCENPLSSPEIQEKKRQTNIEKYGSAYPTHKYGKVQKEIQEWLNSNGFDFKSDHIVLNGKELDLFDANLKLAIEYCGLYWHHESSPQPRLRNYHFDKWKICKEKKIQLITIFEDEWLNNQEIVKSVLLSKVGKFKKRIYARKCTTKEISKKEFIDFCDQYHIQGGNVLAKVCFGLFHENKLVGVMDLGVHHRKKLNNEMVLTRLCFKKGYQIIGGASKLFNVCVNWCKSNKINKIISWSDNRWSNGSVYENLNFQLIKQLGPDYAYVDIKKPNKRISKQSQKKNNTGCPSNITEKAFALQNGLSRIWDCGKFRWEFNI